MSLFLFVIFRTAVRKKAVLYFNTGTAMQNRHFTGALIAVLLQSPVH